jgi:hypothetical protein
MNQPWSPPLSPEGWNRRVTPLAPPSQGKTAQANIVASSQRSNQEKRKREKPSRGSSQETTRREKDGGKNTQESVIWM